MAYDIFVSHSTKDKLFVDALVHHLEKENLRCWYAPRDITAGKDWPAAISEAIKNIPVMLLVFSSSSNSSAEISRELTLAASHNCLVIPVRIENVLPSTALEYHLATLHWLDVFDLETEAAINKVLEGLRNYTQHFASLSPAADSEQQKLFTPVAASIKNSTQRNSKRRGKVAISIAFILVLVAGAFMLTRPTPPNDPYLKVLAVDEIVLQKYKGKNNPSVYALLTRLAPIPDVNAPQDYLVSLHGIGGKYDGKIFRSTMFLSKADSGMSFATKIDGKQAVLLHINAVDNGTMFNPAGTEEYAVGFSYRTSDRTACESMLAHYIKGAKWSEPQ